MASLLERRDGLSSEEEANLMRFYFGFERGVFDSISTFFAVSPAVQTEATTLYLAQQKQLERLPRSLATQGDSRIVFRRNPDIKGTMGAFGYNYFTDKYGDDKARSIRLLRYDGLRGSGGEYAYEVLNFANGKRTVQEIRDAVSAIYGPVPLELVLEYLKALETIKVVQRVEKS
ncbi:MAG: hypothetical protein ABIV48_02045 [Pyrinomonadaceae bacterium]